MSESLHHIDQLFKDGAGDYSEMPAPANWEQLEQKLDKAAVTDLRNKYRYWKRVAAAAILLLSLSAVALLMRQGGSKTAPVVKEIPQQEPVSPRTQEPKAVESLTDAAPKAPVNPGETNKQDQSKTEDELATTKNPAETAVPAIKAGKNPVASNETVKKESVNLANRDEKQKEVLKTKSREGSIIKDEKVHQQFIVNKASSKKTELPLIPEKGKQTLEKGNATNNEADYAARTAMKKAELLQLIRTASLIDNASASTTLPNLNATAATIRNAWKNPIHRFTVGAFYTLQQIHTEVAEGRMEHQEDDHKQIGREEALAKTFEAGLQISYRIKSKLQLLSGVSYSTQQSTIQPKTVFARHDAGRGGPGNPPPPPPGGNGDLRYKLNCAAGYVFLDPKTSTAINFGDSLNTLRAENTLSYINIPVQASYLFRKGRLEFGPVAGITTHILSKAKLNTTLQESSGAKTPQTATINGLKKTYLSGMIGAQGSYSITDRLAVYVLPSTSFSLSPVNQNTPAKTYLRQLGVQTGIRLNL